MAKYIIETDGNIADDISGYLGIRIEICNKRTWAKTDLELTPYTEPDLDAIRKEVHDKCMNEAEDLAYKLYSPKIDEAYQHGLNDAWEAARKICLEDDDGGIPASAINDIFSVRNYRNALRDFSGSEAVKKIRAYEQEQEEIQVGDEIVRSNGEKYVVLIVNDERKLVTILRHDGYKRTIESKWVTKTGRHFPEIAEVLKKMKE